MPAIQWRLQSSGAVACVKFHSRQAAFMVSLSLSHWKNCKVLLSSSRGYSCSSTLVYFWLTIQASRMYLYLMLMRVVKWYTDFHTSHLTFHTLHLTPHTSTRFTSPLFTLLHTSTQSSTESIIELTSQSITQPTAQSTQSTTQSDTQPTTQSTSQPSTQTTI